MPQRFWKFLAFRQEKDITQIDELLKLLSKPDPQCDKDELKLKGLILDGYAAIKNKPFQPHAVARTRHLAYQYSVVMKYLDNLIDWGDHLFRQDTVESINEATQRYVLAANLLGTRPQRIPLRGTVRPKTFKELKEQGLDAMGNALVELESKLPFNQGLLKNQGDGDLSGPLFGIGRTLYFCIPRNEKLLGYWDTVADRLFKIRHCMNIEGVVRQLALFDPPIDPGMLVRAAAAGIDIGSVVSGLNQPVGPVRSLFLIQKALELAGEVRGLGAALLAAIEKGDSERLALLRQGHEIKIQQMQQDVRFLQWKQTQEATESLLKSRASALERYRYYLRLLGQKPDTNAVPDTFSLDRGKLTEDNFDEAYATLIGQYEKVIAEQSYPKLSIAGDSAPANQSGESGRGKLFLNTSEDVNLNQLSPTSRTLLAAAEIIDHLHAPLAFMPTFELDMAYWGIGGTTKIAGGEIMSRAGQLTSSAIKTLSGITDSKGKSMSETASYERRADEWNLQANLAAREMMQIGRQIIGSLIAEQIAHHEYMNVQKQIEQSKEVDQFLHEKFSNEQLYAWMQGELSRLYYEYYRFAFDIARKTEQTMKYELMRPELDDMNYIKFNYWDKGRRGLLSGESLHLDLKRMEMAYHDHNKREYELTKHISLRQLDPIALLRLKAYGTCEVSLPEWLFDLDSPGHYMRRIKNVSLTIPAVTGSFTNVHCTLSLLKSTLRRSPLLMEGEYPRATDEDDTRFADYYGTIQSIVSSNAQNDSGMFEANLRDERFLPFEGHGAISTWRVELPADYRQFDYNTISDIILHLRYTARQGVDPSKVKAALDELFQQADTAGLSLLFSLRYDFSTEWSVFVNGTSDLTTKIRRNHFPYFAQSRTITIDKLEFYDGNDLSNHETITCDDATADLADPKKQAFTLTAGESQVLTTAADEQIFLIIRYSLS